MTISMDYAFMVQRGWPNGCALESNETIKAATTLNAGDVVEMQADGTIDLCGVEAVGLTASKLGYVVRGNGDSDSVAAAGDQAVVLWSNFIARTQGVNITSVNVGDEVCAAAGILQTITTGAPVALVLAVHAAVGAEPASLTIMVK